MCARVCGGVRMWICGTGTGDTVRSESSRARVRPRVLSMHGAWARVCVPCLRAYVRASVRACVRGGGWGGGCGTQAAPCVCARVRACVHACVHACVRACALYISSRTSAVGDVLVGLGVDVALAQAEVYQVHLCIMVYYIILYYIILYCSGRSLTLSGTPVQHMKCYTILYHIILLRPKSIRYTCALLCITLYNIISYHIISYHIAQAEVLVYQVHLAKQRQEHREGGREERKGKGSRGAIGQVCRPHL
jgi:hypothetical protein